MNMLLSQQKETALEDLIALTLQKEGLSGPSLLASISKKNPKVSKETFYRVLRTMLKTEIVIKHSGLYELNRHWLQRVYRFSKVQIETNHGLDSNSILSFKEGDKITYKFSNPNSMGIYWAHTYDMLFEQHDPTIPILIFHPHEWLIHSRTGSELFFLNRFTEDKKLALFSIGGTTALDKKFKKEWESEYIQISTGIDHGLKKTEYINVLGDFIFKVSVSKRFSGDIELFFKKNTEITDENRTELEMICNRKDAAKMVFVRSKKEAALWRLKFNKHFYLPKKYRLS